MATPSRAWDLQTEWQQSLSGGAATTPQTDRDPPGHNSRKLTDVGDLPITEQVDGRNGGSRL